VRDRAAERTLEGRTLGVDVDPLLVAGALRECVDALLIQSHPSRHAQLLSDEAIQRGGAQSRRHG
jgi:hypothetical protein